MKSSLRFLYEAFLPREARFPDEDFWSKRTGEPVMARRAGPPPGTTGTTAKDWGATDTPSAPAGGGQRKCFIMVDPQSTVLGSEQKDWVPFMDKAEELGITVGGSPVASHLRATKTRSRPFSMTSRSSRDPMKSNGRTSEWPY